MKNILMAALTFTLLVHLGIITAAMASPEITDQNTSEEFTEVQTSGTTKVKVETYQGDATIIMDEEGHPFTLGELKASTDVILPGDTNKSNVVDHLNILISPHHDLVTSLALDYDHTWP